MVTMTDQCKEDAGLVVSCDEVKINNKGKSLGLTASNYSAISIDKKHSIDSCDIFQNEAKSAGADAIQGIVNSSNAIVQKSVPLRRRHSINESTQRTSTKPTGPFRTPSFHGAKSYNSGNNNTRPPSGKKNSICSTKAQLNTNSYLGLAGDNKKDFCNSIAGSSADDGVSVISVGDSVKDQSIDNLPENLDCSIKVQRESEAIKQLLKRNSQQGCVCSKTRDSNICNKATVNVCGWGDSITLKLVKSSKSLSKKRSSPAVFNKRVREGKEKMFVFNHHQKISDHMSQYRNEHTVGQVGDLNRVPPVIGRDFLDPYAMKASNVRLMSDISSVNHSSSGMVGGKRKDETNKGNCPNLSPVRSSNSPSFQELDRTTPAQHIISVNDFMEAYLPQPTLPYIQKRPDSTLSTGKQTQYGGTESVSSSSQFDGEIVGVKHKLPTATTCNLSALCKPSADVDIYGDLKKVSNAYRNSTVMRHKAKKLDIYAKSKCDSQLCSAMSRDASNPQEAAESNQMIHTDKGCHGCNRIASLIRGSRHETKSKTFGQCKPLENQTTNTIYRLQKMPNG